MSTDLWITQLIPDTRHPAVLADLRDIEGPRVFRTASWLVICGQIYAACCRFRYSVWTSSGVRYPFAE